MLRPFPEREFQWFKAHETTTSLITAFWVAIKGSNWLFTTFNLCARMSLLYKPVCNVSFSRPFNLIMEDRRSSASRVCIARPGSDTVLFVCRTLLNKCKQHWGDTWFRPCAESKLSSTNVPQILSNLMLLPHQIKTASSRWRKIWLLVRDGGTQGKGENF